jgi:ankyrin repeat protein
MDGVTLRAHEGHKYIVQLLLKAGANVDAYDDNHRSPLKYSINFLHDDVTQILLDNGANPSTKNVLGRTPFHDAAKYDLQNVANMLLAKNADVNAQDGRSPTPLHASAGIYRHGTIMKMLLDKKADQAIQDREGHLPMGWAKQNHGGWKEGEAILLEDVRRELEEYFRGQGRVAEADNLRRPRQ